MKGLLGDERFKLFCQMFECRIRDLERDVLSEKTSEEDAMKLRMVVHRLRDLTPQSLIKSALRSADSIAKRQGI